MYSLLARKGQLFAFLLGAVVIVIFLIMVLSGLSTFNAQSEADQMQTTIFNFGLMSSIVLGILCAVIALLFGVYHLLTNLKGSMTFLIYFGAIIAVFLIGYVMYNSDASAAIQSTIKEFNISDGVSRFISASLLTSIVLSIVAFASFIVFEIINLFK